MVKSIKALKKKKEKKITPPLLLDQQNSRASLVLSSREPPRLLIYLHPLKVVSRPLRCSLPASTFIFNKRRE